MLSQHSILHLPGLLHSTPLSPELVAQLTEWAPRPRSRDNGDSGDNGDNDDDMHTDATVPNLDDAALKHASMDLKYLSDVPSENNRHPAPSLDAHSPGPATTSTMETEPTASTMETAPLASTIKIEPLAKRSKPCPLPLSPSTAVDNSQASTQAEVGVIDIPNSPPFLDPNADQSEEPLVTYSRKHLPTTSLSSPSNCENQPPVGKTAIVPSALPALPRGSPSALPVLPRGSPSALPALRGSRIACKEPRSCFTQVNPPSPTPTQRSPPPPPPPPRLIRHQRSVMDRACLVCRGIRRDRERFQQQQQQSLQTPQNGSARRGSSSHKPTEDGAALLSKQTKVDECFRGSQLVELRATEANGEDVYLDNKEGFETVQVWLHACTVDRQYGCTHGFYARFNAGDGRGRARLDPVAGQNLRRNSGSDSHP